MKCLLFLVGSLFLAASIHADVWGQQSDAPPPEMKPLERFVGTWSIEHQTKVPEEACSTYIVKAQPNLGGRFVQQTGAFDDKGKPMQMGMYTYDSNKKNYRYWFFMSSGFFTDYTGTWDESSQTFTFTNRLPRGARAAITARFLDENAYVFSVITKEAGGDVSYHLEGKAVRQK